MSQVCTPIIRPVIVNTVLIEYIDLSVFQIKLEMRSFKSNENIHSKEGVSYYVVSANKASKPALRWKIFFDAQQCFDPFFIYLLVYFFYLSI